MRMQKILWLGVLASIANPAIAQDALEPFVGKQSEPAPAPAPQIMVQVAPTALPSVPPDSGSRVARSLAQRAGQMSNDGQFAEALAEIDSALDIDPEYFAALVMRGWVQAQLNLADEAEASLDRADALYPGQPITLRGRGFLALTQSDYPTAIDYFNRALILEPRNAFTLNYRGATHFEQGRFEAALDDAETAIAAAPDYFLPYVLRIAALDELGRNEQGMAAIEAMMAAFPGDATVLATASELASALGEEDFAVSLLATSLEAGETPAALLNSAMRREVDETATKLRELNRALELAPDFVLALLERGRTLWAEYRLREALADADRVIELSPQFWPGYSLRGQILSEQGRNSDVATMTAQLVETYGDNSEALVAAIWLYASIEHFTRARAVRDRLRSIDPENPMALTQGNTFFPAD